MRRTICSSCGSPDLETFLDVGPSPVADAYTKSPSQVVSRHPLDVAVCGKCHLVQLLEVLPAEELFGTGYSFYSSASAPLSAYHQAYAKDVQRTHRKLVSQGVVEVGCNDGDMLRYFTKGLHLGVDPSPGPARAASDRGCAVLVEEFSLAVAEKIRDERGAQGVVIANHVLAHVADVSDCLAGIAHLLDDGVALVEVQYLPDLLVNNAFDLVYHEHRNYFSLTSLEDAAHRHGLFVVDVRQTDRQGGSLRVTLSKQDKPTQAVGALRRSETWLNNFGAYEGMQGRAERIRTRLLDLISAQTGTVGLYGAPAKATTLLNWCGLTSDHIPWCIDTTEAKQGRHIPGTGIPIVASGNADTYLLTAWNYARPIMAAHPKKRWIVPIPSPVLL